MRKPSSENRLGVLILAAGKGTRMESNLPKVLHQIAGQPMLHYVLETAVGLKPDRLVVVVGFQAQKVQNAFSDRKRVRWVVQEEMLGTGNAVEAATEAFSGFSGSVLVLYGDIPGIRVETLRRLQILHASSQNRMTLLTAELANPTGYGRIVEGADGMVARIVEEKDASPHERKIKEINTGIGIYDAPFLFSAVANLKPTNRQGELYLTDLVALARSEGDAVGRLRLKDVVEVEGINDRAGLARTNRLFYQRKTADLMRSGVTVAQPSSSKIEPTVEVGKDSSIGISVRLKGSTRIASESKLGSGCEVENAKLARKVEIGENVSVRNAKIGEGTRIGANTVIGK